jgi:hypothetical protein
MQTLKLQGQVDRDGHLRLDVPTALPAGNVELVLVIEPIMPEASSKVRHDFSDLAGQLRWSGEAVEQQRRLRNEWPT